MNLCRNRTVMIGGGICAVLLLVELVVLAIGAVRLSKANAGLRQELQHLTRLEQRNPYPSDANVEVLKNNLDELEFRVGELAAELKRDPFPRDSVEAAEFSARAQDVIERFRNRAVRAGMQLPESLEAGFAQYASGGAVPEAAHVPRLSRQLYSVERVADVLVQSGVTSVSTISRDVFEVSDEPEMVRRRPVRNRPGSGGRKLQPPTASYTESDGIYSIEQIAVSFTASEEVVWRVLDLFAGAPHVMVVSGFSHQTQSDILAYNPSAVKRGEESDETVRYLAEGILSGENALSRPERIISGDEQVSVRLTIDVYNFDLAEDNR
ncbi:Amuc_1100 family pilus-like protein [Pontiellaceae bacterium B1224]|nr:Amuc_1100 family pilus-like protein [Pontiellaceae bacterium B1224]